MLISLAVPGAVLCGVCWLFLMLWMAKFGTGIVPNKDVLNAAKRLKELGIQFKVYEKGSQLGGTW